MATGRYAHSAELALHDGSGRLVRYLEPRILPQGSSVAGAATTRVRADELHRLDLVAYRVLGAPLQAWRIADANDALDPFELCARAGASLRLPGSGL